MASNLHGWQPREDLIIADHYPEGGTELCMSLIPDRTYHAIRKRANLLGVKRAVNRAWVRPDHERVIDRALMGWPVLSSGIQDHNLRMPNMGFGVPSLGIRTERSALRWAA